MTTTHIEYNSKAHISQLDGIRGLAIILVLLNHLFFYIPLAIIGWIGVDLFFVLSGFLITGILLDSKHKENYYLTFIKRRFFRIFPLYFFCLIVFFLIYPTTGATFIINYKQLFIAQGWFWTYTSNLLFAFHGWSANRILDHFWSLAIEEQFYLIWPLIILKCSKRRVGTISFILILLSIIVRNIYPLDPFAYTFTLCRLDGLAIGSLCALLIRYKKTLLERFCFPLMIITFTILVIIALLTHNLRTTNIYFIRIGYTLFDIFFATLLVLSLAKNLFRNIIGRIFSLSFFRFFGKYSYGIYVFHWPFYHLFYDELADLFIFHVGNRLAAGLLSSLVLTGSIIIVSMASFYLLEKPFLNLKNKKFALFGI